MRPSVFCCAIATPAHGGGPLGIDHRLAFDDSGIWNRHNQNALVASTWIVAGGGALWEGDDSRFGHTFRQSVDSLALTWSRRSHEADVLALATVADRRPRPLVPGQGQQQLPERRSGEQHDRDHAVRPRIPFRASGRLGARAAADLRRRRPHEGVGTLADRRHRQAIGTALGAYAHSRPSSLSVGLLPRGVTLGWKTRF
jgi:undecaprenyl-diphosphatase